MKRMRVTGMGLLVALVAGSAFAASASALEPGEPGYKLANLPEVGRCVPTTPKTGEYRGAKCQISEPGKGNYNWIPGPGTKPKFEGTGGSTQLETIGGAKNLIECAASKIDGEFTGPKTESATIDLVGCQLIATGQTCQLSPAKLGEIETPSAVEGNLGFIKGGSKPAAGWDLKVSTPITFSCGKPPETNITLGSIEGSVIESSKKLGKMVTETTQTYKLVAGKQVPEMFEGMPKDTLKSKFNQGATETNEQSGIRSILLSETEEAYELKVKCTNIGC